MVRRRTSSGHSKGRTAKVELDRYLRYGRIVHQLGHNERMYAVFALLIDDAVVLVLSIQPTTRRPKDHPRLVRQITSKHQSRLGNRLSGRQQGKLREPVIKGYLLAVKMRGFIIFADLSAYLDRQPVYVTNVQLTDTTAAIFHRIKRSGHIVTQRIDRARPCDDNAAGHSRLSQLSICPRPQ